MYHVGQVQGGRAGCSVQALQQQRMCRTSELPRATAAAVGQVHVFGALLSPPHRTHRWRLHRSPCALPPRSCVVDLDGVVKRQWRIQRIQEVLVAKGGRYILVRPVLFFHGCSWS